jgi:hypothetical protein
MHIKNRWGKRARQQSLEDIANALSFISWKIASNAVVELENQGFTTESHAHRLTIIGEFLAFLLQIADRLSYAQMDQEARQRFVTALALQMAKTFADNKRDLIGDGEHQKAFVELLNQRAADYAEFHFTDGQAGFDLLRYFGEQVAVVMNGERWVSEYIVDVRGPDAVKDFKRSLTSLLASTQPNITN